MSFCLKNKKGGYKKNFFKWSSTMGGRQGVKEKAIDAKFL